MGAMSKLKLPKCPECGKDVIEFTFTEKTQWYHVINGH